MTSSDVIIYHGTSHLASILGKGQILCHKALDGIEEEQARREYNDAAHRLATRVRAHEKSARISYGMGTDEGYASIAYRGNPLVVLGYGDSDLDTDDVVKKPEVSAFLDDVHLFGTLVENCHVFLDDIRTANGYALPLRKHRTDEPINEVVLELQLPEAIIKRNLISYPLVWWSVPIGSDNLRAIYYKKDADKITSLLAKHQLSNVIIKALEKNQS